MSNREGVAVRHDSASETARQQSPLRPHRWVAAALIDVGRGACVERAERAARTGRYVVPANAWLEVLEVYCAQCRAPYHPSVAATSCSGLAAEHVDYDRPTAIAN